MSLEASIAELTAAVRALTDVLFNPVQPQVISTPVEIEKAEKLSELIEKAIQDEYSQLNALQEVPAEPVTLTYDDVKRATIALSAKSKVDAVELLADYGVKKATELPPEAWDRYVAEAKARAA